MHSSLLFVLLLALGCKSRSNQSDTASFPNPANAPQPALGAPDVPAAHGADDYHAGGSAQVPHEVEWGYPAHPETIQPHDWTKSAPTCTGKQQSPVDIRLAPIVAAKKFEKDQLLFYWPTGEDTYDVFNNRHTVQASARKEERPHRIRFHSETFELRQLHYHKKSEHLIEGEQFALEVHFVHENIDPTKAGTYLVVGVLAEVDGQSSDFSKAITKLASRFRSREERDRFSKVDLKLDLYSLLPKKFAKTPDGAARYLGTFVTYNGSLTTPPCKQAVTWVVLTDQVRIGVPDVAAIRHLKFDVGFENFRPHFDLTADHNPAVSLGR